MDESLGNLIAYDDSELDTFSFCNYSCFGKVSKGKGIYDGDSLYCTIPHKGEFIKLYIRIYGIDTPEIRTRNLEEKAAAKRARQYLYDLIHVNPYNLVKICISNKHGKYYGRQLGQLYQVFTNQDGTINKVSDKPISEMMIASGHAYPYHGGKKKKFNDWYENN